MPVKMVQFGLERISVVAREVDSINVCSGIHPDSNESAIKALPDQNSCTFACSSCTDLERRRATSPRSVRPQARHRFVSSQFAKPSGLSRYSFISLTSFASRPTLVGQQKGTDGMGVTAFSGHHPAERWVLCS